MRQWAIEFKVVGPKAFIIHRKGNYIQGHLFHLLWHKNYVLFKLLFHYQDSISFKLQLKYLSTPFCFQIFALKIYAFFFIKKIKLFRDDEIMKEKRDSVFSDLETIFDIYIYIFFLQKKCFYSNLFRKYIFFKLRYFEVFLHNVND